METDTSKVRLGAVLAQKKYWLPANSGSIQETGLQGYKIIIVANGYIMLSPRVSLNPYTKPLNFH